MENLDQSIPFVVLVAVGALLFFLLRRNESLPSPSGRGAGGEGTPSLAITQVVATPTPLIVEAPTAVIDATAPLIVEAPLTTVAKTRKKRTTKPTPKAIEPTPIDTIVGLLKNKDTLATAFLLREIFDRPVSQR